MKTILFLVALLASTLALGAQTLLEPAAAVAAPSITARPPATEPNPSLLPSQADLLNNWPELRTRDVDSLIRFQSDTVTRLMGVDVSVGGVLPRAVRSRNPLQLINPFAPAEYGSGEDVTSINPRTGRAEGVVLIGIKF